MENKNSELFLSENENSGLISAIEETKQGKEEGFKKLYDSTYQFVYSRAKMLCGSEEETSDVVQEVYISVYRGIHTLKSNESLFSWLKTIIFHTGGQIMKKKGNEILLSGESEETFEALPDETENTEQGFIDKQDIEIIRSCIDRLSDEQRAVILAYYYDNLKVEEIAELLSISVGTVKSRLFSARKKLKEYIEEEENRNGYKLHSFGAASLAFTLKSILQGNMEASKDSGASLYSGICRKLKINPEKGIGNTLEKSNHTVKRGYKNLKTNILTRVADMGSKKLILSAVAAIASVSVAGTAAAVIIHTAHSAKNISDTAKATQAISEESSGTESDTAVEDSMESESSVIDTEIVSSENSASIESGSIESNIAENSNSDSHNKINSESTDKNSSLSSGVTNNSNNTSNSNNSTNPNTSKKESATPPQSQTASVEGKTTQAELKTIKLEEVTTYYGYTGYFTLSQLESDVHLTELGIGDNSKALICASEYIDVDSNQVVCFIFEGDVISGKDLMYNHVYPAGAGKIPVKVTNAKKYERFDQPLNEYIIVEHCYDGSYDKYVNDITIYTVGENPTVEKEIIAKYCNRFGHNPNSNVEVNYYGYFSIDDSGKPYEIYRYHLEEIIE